MALNWKGHISVFPRSKNLLTSFTNSSPREHQNIILTKTWKLQDDDKKFQKMSGTTSHFCVCVASVYIIHWSFFFLSFLTDLYIPRIRRSHPIQFPRFNQQSVWTHVCSLIEEFLYVALDLWLLQNVGGEGNLVLNFLYSKVLPDGPYTKSALNRVLVFGLLAQHFIVTLVVKFFRRDIYHENLDFSAILIATFRRVCTPGGTDSHVSIIWD